MAGPLTVHVMLSGLTGARGGEDDFGRVAHRGTRIDRRAARLVEVFGHFKAQRHVELTMQIPRAWSGPPPAEPRSRGPGVQNQRDVHTVDAEHVLDTKLPATPSAMFRCHSRRRADFGACVPEDDRHGRSRSFRACARCRNGRPQSGCAHLGRAVIRTIAARVPGRRARTSWPSVCNHICAIDW